MTDSSRQAEVELELDATLEEAWRAITEAGELARWFALSARVEPREGGAVEWSWGDRFHWATRIERWAPPHHLRLVQDVEHPRALDGTPIDSADAPPARMVLEFTLEGRGGRTRLRLVHSGFGQGAAWDDELDGVRNGWAYELRSLRHYLAHHRGRDRHHGWAMVSTPVSQAEAWRRLLAPGGFLIQARTLAEDQPYTVRLPGGSLLTGRVGLHVPEREFYGTVDQLGNGGFRLGTWAAGGATGVNVWLATYAEEHRARAAALAAEAQAFLDRAFTAPEPNPTQRSAAAPGR